MKFLLYKIVLVEGGVVAINKHLLNVAMVTTDARGVSCIRTFTNPILRRGDSDDT